MKLTLLYQKAEEGVYIGQIKEIPEALSQAETLEELKENLIEVVEILEDEKEALEALKEFEDGSAKIYTLEEVEAELNN